MKGFYDICKILLYRLPFGTQALISKLYWKPKFGEKVKFSYGPKTYYGKVSFGRGTKVSGYSVYTNIEVGNYTVFAEGFRVLGFVHEYDAFSINDELPDMIGAEIDDDNIIKPRITQYPITSIGSDVWIGENVTVKGGVKIGDGSIIAARSVVTKDVEPFSIVGGVPAKFIKWRFDKEKIALMKKIRWWEWSEERIKGNYERLCRFDSTLAEED
ncbi:acetyltransferase [Butyrivibrio proteoclasticus B316]|uniref:Acetyltransferase n=1 Tax=Butyrivibrio proteoclasticus (strain ATCC 51982 / DSM 14932 / B316) TaxID=515622 RepID=E0RZE8_BUTPB|nr:CatB-related O-acetyltransferase [Butyrivibrio proteoclasticus]ADL33145.1 acetyltransferase [Butyrivibrio proteoclasticus B316]